MFFHEKSGTESRHPFSSWNGFWKWCNIHVNHLKMEILNKNRKVRQNFKIRSKIDHIIPKSWFWSRIWGYIKFWFTKICHNLIIALFFDVVVSLSNFNKWTKKSIASARLFPSLKKLSKKVEKGRKKGRERAEKGSKKWSKRGRKRVEERVEKL